MLNQTRGLIVIITALLLLLLLLLPPLLLLLLNDAKRTMGRMNFVPSART